MDDGPRAEIPIAFTTCGDGKVEATRGEPVTAYASVDVGDEESCAGCGALVPPPSTSSVPTIGPRTWSSERSHRSSRSSRGACCRACTTGAGSSRARSPGSSSIMRTSGTANMPNAGARGPNSSTRRSALILRRGPHRSGVRDRRGDGGRRSRSPGGVDVSPSDFLQRPLAFVRANRSDIVQHLERFRPRSVAALVDQETMSSGRRRPTRSRGASAPLHLVQLRRGTGRRGPWRPAQARGLPAPVSRARKGGALASLAAKRPGYGTHEGRQPGLAAGRPYRRDRRPPPAASE